MTVSNFLKDVCHYLRVRGTEQEYMLLTLLNDSIFDLMRLQEWRYLKVKYDLVLDDSDSYNLDTLFAYSYLSDPFYGEISLYQEGQELIKTNYDLYIQEETKTGLWAMLGNTLYVEGDDVTLTLIYKSPGYPFPLVASADENRAIKYYWDVLQKMVAVKYLTYINDANALQLENNLLQAKLVLLRQDENRIDHKGKFHNVSR